MRGFSLFFSYTQGCIQGAARKKRATLTDSFAPIILPLLTVSGSPWIFINLTKGNYNEIWGEIESQFVITLSDKNKKFSPVAVTIRTIFMESIPSRDNLSHPLLHQRNTESQV